MYLINHLPGFTTSFFFSSFCLIRAFEDEGKARLGVMECAKHELLQPFNVLNEKEGEWNNEMPLMTLLTMKVLHMYLSLHAQ